MKKVLIIIISLFLLTSCSLFNKEEKKDNKLDQTKAVETNETPEPEEPKYVDDNKIVIGLYERSGNELKLLKEFNSKIETKKDIKTFQAFPSQDEIVNHQGKRYADFYYEKWNEVNPDKKYKVGFNLSYTLNDGTKISQNIFGPSTTQTNYDYIEVYLYDAYKHRNDSFYSHIEESEYNDETLITSIKLTAGSKFSEISSKIELSVFTYDEDDFDEETKEYRGNSKYSVIISDLNKEYN